MPPAYRVLVGCNYRPNPKAPEVRAEPGDVVDDMPAKAARALGPDVVEPVED